MTSSAALLWTLIASLGVVLVLLVVACTLVAGTVDIPGPRSMVPMFVAREDTTLVVDGLVRAPTGNGIPITVRLQLRDDPDAAQVVELALAAWAANGDEIALDSLLRLDVDRIATVHPAPQDLRP